MQVKKQQNQTWNNGLVPNWERSKSRLCIVTLFIQLICRVHHVKCQAGWITSWNQNFWEKYQQPQICRWYHSNDRKWRGTKVPLDESERGEWKGSLKISIQKTKIIAPSSITSWQIDEEKVETVADFIFLGCKITKDSDCSHNIKRCLLFGRKAVASLDSVLKSRDVTLPTKVCIVKPVVFLVILYGCESWTIKNLSGEEYMLLNCGWRRLLRVPWTGGRSNQSILKEIHPEYSLEGLMLKLQYFGYWCKELTHWKRPWCWERLKEGEEGNDRGWDGWMASPDSMDMSLSKLKSWWWTENPGVLQSMGLQRVGHYWATEQQQKDMYSVLKPSLAQEELSWWASPLESLDPKLPGLAAQWIIRIIEWPVNIKYLWFVFDISSGPLGTLFCMSLLGCFSCKISFWHSICLWGLVLTDAVCASPHPAPSLCWKSNTIDSL